jgi:ribose-phosphate pyrophosphokinase
VTRVVCVDLHAGQIQAFFNVPFDHLYALPIFLNDYLKPRFDENVVFVSPDAGGVERTRAYSKRLGASLAIIDKRPRCVMDNGAKRVVACATHGVLSGPAVQRITESPLDEVVVSNSIPLRPEAKACGKIRTVSTAPLLAEAIRRIDANDSVSSLFV